MPWRTSKTSPRNCSIPTLAFTPFASGEIVGLLYAGNGSQTYACPIDAVAKALNVSL
jgi:hypothetical protein